jgi:nucleoside-diphosphate-sugar epimerase
MLLLLTGATSPLGTAVAAHFTRAGHHVRGLVRTPDHPAPPTTELVLGDVTDRATLLAAARDIDVAVHCAASHSSDLAEARHVNVTGTERLCDALLASPSRPLLIHISTLSVYDDAAGPDYDEDSPRWTQPDIPYAFTKADAERVVQDAIARGLSAVILRPTMILSMHPRARWGPQAVARARGSDACILPFPELPYTHEDNVVAAIALAARTPAALGRAYNVVDAVADTREYLNAVYTAAGKPTPPIPPDAPRLRFAAERIRRELDWSPGDRWRDFLDLLRRHGGGPDLPRDPE